MSSTNATVYLISGANRGLGLALAATLAARPNTIVFAGARDPAATKALNELAAKHPNVQPVKLTAGDKADNEAAVAQIKKTAGRLDVLIPNAGIMKHHGPLGITPLSEMREHWEVNTLGFVVLYQAAHELLLASPTGKPTIAYISSVMGSIGSYFHTTAAPYGSSKAAANFLVKVLDAEQPALIAMAIHPGWVQTDMGNGGAELMGKKEAPVTVDKAIEGILVRIDGATKEKSSGRFFNLVSHDGNPWDIATEEILW
ncbi:hypothetical protein B0H15DRAFT_876490 [Mycena belliarum]|uniref:NAD(P)-binding protein n=1 Tax=Mycena belliarum TaxID=1033014 RepID=A0AAD6UJW3_9AGAR|nr:hypothetical protein B0H15DRAFT_876490 [Mycena belliae]